MSDMVNSVDALDAIEDKLRNIGSDLNESTQKMLIALQASQGFLEGNQFHKAKMTTMNCIEISSRTMNNIQNARQNIAKLRTVLEQYLRCEYSGGHNDEY